MLCCYLLKSTVNQSTYIGCTNDLVRRLRQHNREITGGANRTRDNGPWQVVVFVTGFKIREDALRFEWRWSHPQKRRNGLAGRITALNDCINRERWTSTSPLAKDVPLAVWWMVEEYKLLNLPEYCTEHYS